MRTRLGIFATWLKALSPPIFVILLGILVFKQAIAESLLATPHPGIIYLIFAGFSGGVILSWYCLYQISMEELFLDRWRSAGMLDRSQILDLQRRKPLLLPVYELLAGNRRLPVRMRQAAVEVELEEFQTRLSVQLTLPGYIGGALIGIGLVGTFIGLLDTLKELSQVFNSISVGVTATESQIDMFREMVRRLQAPMRGMGTAFVASLYGLLGSLVLGVVVVAVRKGGAQLLQRVRQSVREYDYGAGGSSPSPFQVDTEVAWAEAERWNALYREMRERNDTLMTLLLQSQDEFRMALKAMSDLNLAMRERGELDQTMARLLADISSLTNRSLEQHQSLMRVIENSEQGRQQLQEQVGNVTRALIERNEIDHLAQRLVSHGPHWLEAWDQIGTELRRVRGHAEASSHELLGMQAEQLAELRRVREALVRQDRDASHQSAEHQALMQVLQSCQLSFEETSARLRVLLGIQATNVAD